MRTGYANVATIFWITVLFTVIENNRQAEGYIWSTSDFRNFFYDRFINHKPVNSHAILADARLSERNKKFSGSSDAAESGGMIPSSFRLRKRDGPVPSTFRLRKKDVLDALYPGDPRVNNVQLVRGGMGIRVRNPSVMGRQNVKTFDPYRLKRGEVAVPLTVKLQRRDEFDPIDADYYEFVFEPSHRH